jgi:hypothetical protein
MADEEDSKHEPLTEGQRVAAKGLPWYREWLLSEGYEEEDVDA